MSTWSPLLYAKSLRSRIQQRGTDCYFRRLDEVVAYLERHFPDPSDNKQSAKLAILYLLELAAASLSHESLGFADRAHRLLRNCSLLKDERPFRWFYELLSRYNLGVAHFHDASYRKAVLEFNYVVYEIERTKKKASTDPEEKLKLLFYTRRSGDRLLYLPSIIYRADVQLKLQLAYHALKTLRRCKIISRLRQDDYKSIKAKLIEAQAYQLMGELSESSARLGRLWRVLFEGKVSNDMFPHGGTKRPAAFEQRVLLGEYRQNVKGRLLSLAMDQQLNYLERERERKLVDDPNADVLLQWIKGNVDYFVQLGQKSFLSYFKAVEYEQPSRQGYWEQLTEYLAWLTGIAQTRRIRDDEVVKAELPKVASFLAEKVAGRTMAQYLLEESPGEDWNMEWHCRWCDPKGIELVRLPSDHYDEFCERMLKVLDSTDKLGLALNNEKEGFISRLIGLEEKHRNDLRIRDLELRYRSASIVRRLRPEYCLKDVPTDRRVSFDLLPCSTERTENVAGGATERCEISHDGCGTVSNAGLLPREHYERVMDLWDYRFLHQLEKPSRHERLDPGFYFVGLQRWNSSSPAKGYSLGGGYLIYRLGNKRTVEMGIAIDPGFDFVRNLFHMGFSLCDIDIVIISHAHVDHVRDFESIVTLLFELAKRKNTSRKVHVILSLGVYRKLEYIIENPDLRIHVEPYIIDIEREIETDYFERLPNEQELSFVFASSDDFGGMRTGNRFRAIVPDARPGMQKDFAVRISPTRAYHDDKSDSDSFGFLISLGVAKGSRPITVGYTGDTKWIYPTVEDPRDPERRRLIRDITDQYNDCDVLVVHLGSLIEKRREGDGYSFQEYDQCADPNHAITETECEKLVRKKGHPYIIGLLRLLTSLSRNSNRRPLVLLSEFGEELRGKIRVDLARRLLALYQDKMHVLPVDVGINVQLAQADHVNKGHRPEPYMRVWCVQCRTLVPLKEAAFEHFGVDEAIYCVCKTCLRATPPDVLQNCLRQLYEVGYELSTD